MVSRVLLPCISVWASADTREAGIPVAPAATPPDLGVVDGTAPTNGASVGPTRGDGVTSGCADGDVYGTLVTMPEDERPAPSTPGAEGEPGLGLDAVVEAFGVAGAVA
jgi:hypothetical protein